MHGVFHYGTPVPFKYNTVLLSSVRTPWSIYYISFCICLICWLTLLLGRFCIPVLTFKRMGKPYIASIEGLLSFLQVIMPQIIHSGWE